MLFGRGSGDQMQVMKQLQLIYLLSWGLGFKPSEISQILSVLGRVNILFEKSWNVLEDWGRSSGGALWQVAHSHLSLIPSKYILLKTDLSSQIQALLRG